MQANINEETEQIEESIIFNNERKPMIEESYQQSINHNKDDFLEQQ